MTIRPRWLGWLARASAIAIITFGIIWLLHGMNLAEVGHTLATARLWPIAVAAAINFGLIGCKAIAWRILLGSEHPVRISRLVNYTITSCAASVILPLRAGEVIRLWLLRDRDGVPMAQSAAVALAEKLLDVIAMLIVVAPLPWLVPELPAALAWWIGGLAIGALVAMVALRVVGTRLGPTHRLGAFVARLAVVQQPRVFVTTTAVLVASWLIDLAMIALCAWAVGIDLPIGAGVLVLFAINVTIAIPSTPAQLGALELGAVLGLHALHVSDERSLAFALIYHALQIIPITIAGLALNARALVSFRGS